LLLIILYLHQNKKNHGFPFNEKLNSGSKLILFDEKEKSNIVAGFSREKVGINDIPLFVKCAFPEISINFFGVLS